MSYVGGRFSRRLFGGTPPTANGSVADECFNAQSQLLAELLTATCSRIMRGPRHNGHHSAQVIVGAGSTPVGNLTVWYSNLLDPDPTNDAHWMQDTSISSVNLGAAASSQIVIGNVNFDWIRYKALVTSGTISLIVYARSEGVEIG